VRREGILMPTISGIHHACITVSDIERSKKWYEEHLGLRVVSEFDLDTPDLGVGVGLPGAHLLGAMLQWGEGEKATYIELLQYLKPKGKKQDPDEPMCNLGTTHVAFSTENAIDALYEELAGKGVKFYSPPQPVDVGGTVVKFCYFKDPDGISLELIGT
jgi:catechol 2,3-dioxygenase-like lactoylglutathione lyase family enzyme